MNNKNLAFFVNYREIGQRIRLERQKQRMNQEMLAEKVGVSSSFVGHIERGEKKASIETLASLSIVLGMNMHYMIFGTLKEGEQTSLLKREIQDILDKYR